MPDSTDGDILDILLDYCETLITLCNEIVNVFYIIIVIIIKTSESVY